MRKILFPIITVGFLLLMSFLLPPPSAAFADKLAAGSTTQTPTSTPTSTSIPTGTQSPPPIVSDTQFYKDLIETYNDNSNRILDIAKWIIVIVSIFSGGGGAYFYISGNNKINETHDSIRLLKQELTQLSTQSQVLQDNVKAAKSEIREFEEKLNEFSILSDGVQKNIKTMREETFRQQVFVNLKSQHSSLRLSAVQRLGCENCEDTIVSALVECLKKDTDCDVRVEAASAIGQVLCSEIRSGITKQPIFQYGLRALLDVLNTKDKFVHLEAFRALLSMKKSGHVFSKADLIRLRMAHNKITEEELKKETLDLFIPKV